MKQSLKLFGLTAITGLLVLTGMPVAHADNTGTTLTTDPTLHSNECDIGAAATTANASTACPGGGNSAVGPAGPQTRISPNPQFVAARSVAYNIAAMAIDAFGICRYIDNNGGNTIFVPFASTLEWNAFLQSHLPNIVQSPCAVPISSAPGTTGQLAIYPTSACLSPQPTQYLVGVPYYGRPSAVIPAAPSSPMVFTCMAGTGTDPKPWKQTVTALTYMAAASANNTGTVPWSVSATYSGAAPPTVALTATPDSIAPNASVTVSWTSTDTTACSDPLGTGVSKASNGSVTISPSVTTTYSITCTGSGGTASSTTTVTVSAATCPSETVTDSIFTCRVDPSSAWINPAPNGTGLGNVGCHAYSEDLSAQRIITGQYANYTQTLPASDPGQSYMNPPIGADTQYVWYNDYAQYTCTKDGWTHCYDLGCGGTGGGKVDPTSPIILHPY